MSNINYSLNNRGVRLIDSKNAFTKCKNGNLRLNPKYNFVGKIDVSMPNMIISATDNSKPKYRGNTYDLNRTAKTQIVDHFFDDKGKRTRKRVAYFGIEKNVAGDKK